MRKVSRTAAGKSFVRSECAPVLFHLGFQPGTRQLTYTRPSRNKIDRVSFFVQSRRDGGIWMTFTIGIIFSKVEELLETAKSSPPGCATIGCTAGLLIRPYRYLEWNVANEFYIAQHREEILHVLRANLSWAFDRIHTLYDLKTALEDPRCLDEWTLTHENRFTTLAATLWVLGKKREAMTILQQSLTSPTRLNHLQRLRVQAFFEFLTNLLRNEATAELGQ